jgi:hypothetical protein
MKLKTSNMKNLEQSGLVALDAVQLQQIQGGAIVHSITPIIIAVLTCVINGKSCFAKPMS